MTAHANKNCTMNRSCGGTGCPSDDRHLSYSNANKMPNVAIAASTTMYAKNIHMVRIVLNRRNAKNVFLFFKVTVVAELFFD